MFCNINFYTINFYNIILNFIYNNIIDIIPTVISCNIPIYKNIGTYNIINYRL